MLSDGRKDVEREPVCRREIAANELDLAVHQGGDEGNVAAQSIELRDDQLRLVLPASREGGGELRAVVALAALHFAVFPDQLPVSAVQVVLDSFALGFDPITPLTLLVGRNAKVGDEFSPHGTVS